MDHLRTADRVELELRRALFKVDVLEVEDRLAVVAEVVERLQRQLDGDAIVALRHGASCAEVGRLLGVSRQAVRKRLLPLAVRD